MSKPPVPVKPPEAKRRHRWLGLSALLVLCTLLMRRDSEATKH